MPSGSQSRGKRRQNSRRHASAPHGIGQLDIVSAEPDPEPHPDRHQASAPMAASKQTPRRVPTPHPSQDDGNVSDEDLLQLQLPDDDFPQGNVGAGATTSKQSSPAISKVGDELWKANANYSDDDYELPATSSPKNDNLPDTLPLPQVEQLDPDMISDVGKHSPVDLSETATTARRSPSLRPSEAQEYPWTFVSSRATSKRAAKDQDHSSVAGEELPAVVFPNAQVARVKKAPDADEGEQSREQQIQGNNPEQQMEGNEAEVDIYDDSGLAENIHFEDSNTSTKVIVDQKAPPAPADDKPLGRKHLEDITRANAKKPVPHEKFRSPIKRSTQVPSSNAVNTSGKKRKQRAKDPIVFDAVTQEVNEGPAQKKRSPAAPQSATKTVKKSALATKTSVASTKKSSADTKSPAISKKRPAPKASHRPAKKAKTETQPKQPSPIQSPKRTSHRAAAQAAQAAVKQQLDSSPCSEAKAPDALESKHHSRQPVVEQVRKPLSPEKGAPNPMPPSTKGFGGVSGRMYTAEPQLPAIRDSQNDTQDLIWAHIAEEQAIDSHISISSDQSSEADYVEPLISPPRLPQSVSEHANREKASQPQPQAADTIFSTRADTSAHQGIMKNARVATTKTKNVIQHDYGTPQDECGLSSKAEHLPSQAPRSLAKSKEHVAEPKSNSSRRYSQANLRLGDAFVNDPPLEDRGRARTKSTWNRTLSVSQQGSPNRLGNGENKHSNACSQDPADEPPASSAVKDCLGNSSQRSPHPVSRRLSYHPVPIKAKQPESTKNAPQSGLTGETFVDSRGSEGQTSKPIASRNGITPTNVLKIKNKIYNQILMAGREEEEEEPKHQTPEPVQVSEKTSPMGLRRNYVADQLTIAVHMITQRLYESEEGTEDTVEAYEAGTSKCVQRIQHRLDREHKKLLEQWKDDSERFGQVVEKAKRPILDAATARSNSAQGLEQTVAKRQRLYDQASRSLRAFHNQVMRG